MNIKPITATMAICLTAAACGTADNEISYPVPTKKICEMAYTPQATRFEVWAPTADSVCVDLYRGDNLVDQFDMLPDDDGLWQAEAAGDRRGEYYAFRVKCDGKWLAPTAGIFARAVSINGDRGAIVDMRATDPDGWSDDRAPVQGDLSGIVIYEMHYRVMTAHPSAGCNHGGKYVDMAQSGTRSDEGLATGLDHLRELGVSHVHLLPTADFGSIDESIAGNDAYNWGYEPKNYNVPEGSYSTDAGNPEQRIREFKEMVAAMHAAGLRVVMDVVYNHTTDVQRCGFELTVPAYFYRMTPNGGFANGSGCGNETASEREMMRKFIVESLEYWVEEYHIDGFRFDLMAIHDIETMNLIRSRLSAIDPSILLYGEGWAASDPAYDAERLAFKRHTHRMPGIAAFSDDMRDALRGRLDCSAGGFVHGVEGNAEAVRFGIAGGIEHPGISYREAAWAAEPTQHISYVTCHDDHCLRDRLEILSPEASEEELLRMDKLAQTAVFTSQGIPFIFCGEELYRSKQHVGNSYKSPDSVNAIDWGLKCRYAELYDYYRNLIAMRRSHPAFCLGSAEAVRRHLEFLPCENECVVAFRLKDIDSVDRARSIVVVLNGSRERVETAIPDASYTVVARDGRFLSGRTETQRMTAAVTEPVSATILVEK
ncbi:MAG: type I pullulanase [Alistipes sp.]|nr:type I pullulanase [Alistipes sp.]